MGTAEAVERAVAPALEVLGYELLDVETRPGLVRITIDRDSGLDMAALGQASSAVSGVLDATDVVPGGRYELEVSSPGVERRLRKPEHYSKVVGSQVAVRLHSGTDGQRRLEGRMTQAKSDGIVLLAADEGEGGEVTERFVAYADIERAHTVFDWRAALAADSASRQREDRRAARPSAADRSRAAAAARNEHSHRGNTAGTPLASPSLPADDLETTESE